MFQRNGARFCRGLVLLSAGLASSTARAQEQSWSILGHLGGAGLGSDPNLETRPMAGLSALVNYGHFTFGTGVDLQTSLASNVFQVHALGGFLVAPLERLQVRLLGTFGPRYYVAWGKRFFHDDPGVDGLFTAAGVRALITYTLVKWQTNRLLLGAYAGSQDDLTRETTTYTYVERSGGFLGSEYSEEDVTNTRTLGMSAFFLTATFGAEFDL